MPTPAFYHTRNIEIDLADLPRELYSEIVSLRGQIDPPPAPPVITCLGNGEPMYVYRHESGRYFARHYPNGNQDGHNHRIATMSDAHRRQAEYSQRAALQNGLTATLEKSTGNGTRLDVAVFGEINIGMEIQRSRLSRARAKTRAMKSFNAGWPTAWVTDEEQAPDWADHVPTARLTLRGGWDHEMPPPNTAQVIIGRFTRERDSASKTGWRYQRSATSVLLDELAYLMPAGEIVPIAVGTKGQVSLAHRESYAIIDSCTYPGASQWRPTTSTPQSKTAAQTITRPCERHTRGTLEAPIVGGVVICRFCGRDINPVFQITAHYDCARKHEGTQQ